MSKVKLSTEDLKNESTDISALFRQYYRELCLCALHYVKDTGMAEDIVMDCFLKFYDRQRSGETFASARSYLYMMVRHACVDQLRKGGVAVISAELPDIPDEPLDDAMARSELEAQLWTAIDSLPSGCRNILLLSKRDGLKNKEIASRLGISVKTVEAQMTKAFKVLRKLQTRRK